jgi:hypothetical protein
VPVIVTVKVPGPALAPAVNVNALLVVAGLGLNAAVTPFGKPVAENVTLPLKPLTGVIVIVLLPLGPPFVTETAVGEAERLNPGATVRLSVVVWFSVPDVPVMDTV